MISLPTTRFEPNTVAYQAVFSKPAHRVQQAQCLFDTLQIVALPYYGGVLHALQAYLREHGLVRPGDRVGVAVSGGADSTALLCALTQLKDELGILLSVVHVNHNLRPEADEDQQFVEELARRLALPCFVASRDVRAWAAEHGHSLESGGRHVRYQYFAELITSGVLDKVATAHTLDDQAETVLLRLLRGAGTRGLAGVYRSVARMPGEHRVSTGNASEARIVRPLLGTTRKEIQSFLESLNQPWREDASNRDRKFLRNRVRHELLPILERDFNPATRRVLAETAEIARDEEAFWSVLTEQKFKELGTGTPGVLDARKLATLETALQRRVLRRLAAESGVRLDFAHLERVRALALAQAAGACELPARVRAEVIRDKTGGLLLTITQQGQAESQRNEIEYDYALPIPGEVYVPELNLYIRARLVEGREISPEYNSALIEAASVLTELRVRNWRPGDRFRPLHTSSEEKLKRLLQELRVPESSRRGWPVVTSGERIVWVRGMNVGHDHALRSPGSPAVLIVCEEPN